MGDHCTLRILCPSHDFSSLFLCRLQKNKNNNNTPSNETKNWGLPVVCILRPSHDFSSLFLCRLCNNKKLQKRLKTGVFPYAYACRKITYTMLKVLSSTSVNNNSHCKLVHGVPRTRSSAKMAAVSVGHQPCN